MPVFAHSMDVALLCLDRYPMARERFPGFRLDVVLLGAVVHDLTKLRDRSSESPSHSYVMTYEPSLAVAAAMWALDEAQTASGVWLDVDGIDHLWHVVAAHHGPWGKVRPATAEASLLYHADSYSATHHRTAPVDANDILPLLHQGYSWTQIGSALGVTRALVKARLQDACRSEGVHGTTDLLARWIERGAVRVGDDDRTRQIARARYVVEFARRCPESLIEAIRPALGQLGDQAIGHPEGRHEPASAR